MVNIMKSDAKEEKLQQEIEQLKKDLEEVNGNWKRALADYQNLEKRTFAQKQEFGKYTTKILLGKFLDVLDLLYAAQKHLQNEGLDLVIRKFLSINQEEGLIKIETAGKEFDPKIMECIEIIEGDNENIVAEEVRSGYLLNNDYLIRTARVKVYKKINKNPAQQELQN